MSIETTFDPNSEEIVKAAANPEHAGGARIENFPEIVLMTFSEKMLKLALAREGTNKFDFLLAGSKVPLYRLPLANGKSAAIMRTGMGAPLAAAMMEEMIAKGAKKFIVFGSCGVLVDLPEGHVIVPTRAYRDEGTSYHYAPASDYMEIKNAYFLAGLFNGLNVDHVMGGLWTTDGLYRETRDNMEKRKADGCIAVDMECSALQAVCNFRGCELYQFVYAEDSLAEKEWDPRNLGKVASQQMERHLELAMTIAKHI